MLGSSITWKMSAHEVHALGRDLLGARMGGEDDDVAGLDGVDALTGRRQAGVRGGNEGCDYADRLGVLHKALFLILFNDADAGLTQAVAQDQLELVALVALAHLVAEVGLIDRLVAEMRPDLEIVKSRSDRLCQTVHTSLIVSLDDRGSLLCTGDHFLDHFDLLLSNFLSHNDTKLLFVVLTKVLLGCWHYFNILTRDSPILDSDEVHSVFSIFLSKRVILP